MADTPFLLEPREVAKAVREAMADGRINFARDGCLYRYDDGGCCAIGAALPDDIAVLADGLDNDTDAEGTAIEDCIKAGLFAVQSDADFEVLKALQVAHDNGRSGEFEAALKACEAA